MRRLWMMLMLCGTMLCLCGCTVLDAMQTSAPQMPDLRLLERPVYEDEAPAAETEAEKDAVLRLDLWMDASQVMGGVNGTKASMYPHYGRKYREGGFHYRYQKEAGLYESLLRCMLSSAEGSRVRILRCGNERLPDDYLLSTGVASASASQQELRSLRRDMLTYAIDPMPTIFSQMSAENMADSFYSLGTPMLNQLPFLNRAALENPAQADVMSAALDNQIASIEKTALSSLTAVGEDRDAPVLYALRNMDLSRLSVIAFDPAGIRRLSTVANDGSVTGLLTQVLEERGVFDQGLSVGLYAFQLDYLGQIATFGAADLSEPLIWGRLRYNSRTHRDEAPLPMPRILLALVVGEQTQLEAFTGAFNAQMELSEALKQLRGSEKGELTYAQNGQTVTQQPFGFEYHYLTIERPQIRCLTQHSPGVVMAAQNAAVSTEGSVTTLTLTPDESGVQPNRTFTLTLPLEALPQGVSADLTAMAALDLTVEDSLLLSGTLPNTPEASVAPNAQTIALRDRLYVFEHQGEGAVNPFSCTGVTYNSDHSLTLTIQADGSALLPGYYHLKLSADLAGGGLSWSMPSWVSSWNAAITNEQIAQWEAFTQLMTAYDRKRDIITRPFQHAWGPATEDTYHGSAYPDCPPVYKALWLEELVSQTQAAADLQRSALVRYGFDVFVTGGE